MTTTDQRTVATLAADTRSPALARRLVEGVLTKTGLGQLLDDALLLVTELVTNAVVHAGTQLELELVAGAEGIRVEVSDGNHGRISVDDQPATSREGGRGLYLLHTLATEWGMHYRAAGKAIWFTLTTAPAPAATVVDARILGAGDPDSAEPVAARRDFSFLAGMPADIEELLSPGEVVSELLRRVVEGLGLDRGWVVAQGERAEWSAQAAYDDEPAPDPEALRRGRRVDAQVLPLHGAGGVQFGALVLSGGTLDADSFTLARLVASRISVILRDQRLTAAQHRDRGSMAILAEASEMFAGTLDVQLTATLTAQLVVPRPAAWAVVWSGYEHLPRLLATAHSDEAQLDALAESWGGDHALRLTRRLLSGGASERPVMLSAEELPAELGTERAGGALVLPLVARRRLVGLLFLGQPGHLGAEVDRELLRGIARLAALAIDNARLYEDRSTVAGALQAYLLPAALPTTTGMSFGARYAPAGEGNEVGGDFYDVFSAGHGAWGITIGDVCGKGAPAAAVTGMARDVLRLLTRDGVPAPAALTRLNRTLLELGEQGRFCSVLLGAARAEPDGVHISFSNAGHPPPVLVTAAGEAAFVGSTGTLVGVVDDLDLGHDEVVLRPGDSLVLYTDGVTERRGKDGMFGDEHLLTCLERSAGLGAADMAAALEAAATRFAAGSVSARDDLAVLVVRAS